MSEFTALSGAQVVINLAPWEDASKLKRVFQREASAAGIALSMEIDNLAKLFLRIDGSDEFDAALWPCLARCLRGGEKITKSTFDKEEARKDYYDIAFTSVKENLGPLAESLRSKLFALGILKKSQAPSAPESPSTTISPS